METSTSPSNANDLDVLVVGAGISGINAAYRLQTLCPDKRYAIVEGRAAIGGTWDLFRYPGIRSDSDMYTLGFPFRPWDGEQMIADGATIRAYVEETARVFGIDQKIRFRHRVVSASWSSDAARWRVEVARPGPDDSEERAFLSCRFLFMCTGYYDYAHAHTPDFPGRERFLGRVVHPQLWPEDLDYEGKRVVVIGSGATAVGLVPALAARGAHVTMLQRSPTYMMSFPGVDPMSRWLDAHVPHRLASGIMHARNTALAATIYGLCRRFPKKAREVLIGSVRKQITRDVDVDTHFTPRYAPWDQRLCLIRDGDLFTQINRGAVDVVTDHIDTFTETGVRLRSGRELSADIIVTATGLTLRLLGGVPLTVDGREVPLAATTMYKGSMLSGVPNLATAIGYINASWTLRSDLICQYVCRVLEEMDQKGYRSCVPRVTDDVEPIDEPVLPLASGYIERARGQLPGQGSKRPWRNIQGYLGDLRAFRAERVDDGALTFAR